MLVICCSQHSGVLLLALTLLLTVVAESQALGMREVWVAVRDDERPGTGAVSDPFDGGTVNKLNGLFEKLRNEYGDNLTINFGTGGYEGDRLCDPGNQW